MDITQFLLLSIIVQCSALICSEKETAIEDVNCCMKDASSKFSPNIRHLRCFKDNEGNINDSKKIYFEAKITTTLIVGTTIAIQCSADIPNIHNVLDHLGIDDVIEVTYIKCSIDEKSGFIADSFGENASKVAKLEFNFAKIVGNLPMQPNNFKGIQTTIKDLQFTYTSYAAASLLSEDYFDNFTSLENLVLKQNRLRRLPASLNTIKNLSYLDLSNNLIKKLDRSTFRGLGSLTKLSLEKNPIKHIQADAFTDLHRLKYLNFRNVVTLSDLPDNVFSGLHSLETLILDSCSKLNKLTAEKLHGMQSLKSLSLYRVSSITNLPENLLSNLPNLEEFTASECQFSTLPPKLLMKNLKLSTVAFSNNNLSEIPQDLFATNSMLEQIDLSGNNIASIDGVFDRLHNLKQLFLSRNNLSRISSTVFQDLNSLTELLLQYNHIRQIDSQAFYNLVELRTLVLSKNELEHFGDFNTTFPPGCRLEKLRLSWNKIKTFPQLNFHQLPFFKSMDLNNNRLTSFTTPRLLSNPTDIQMTFNQIRTVTLDVHDNEAMPQQARTFQLHGNPFHCDCKLFDFIKYIRGGVNGAIGLFIDTKRYKCANIDADLLTLDLKLISCPTEFCPTGCQCREQPFDSSCRIECRNQNLTDIPLLPQNVTHVDFRGNRLTEYPMKLSEYPNLAEVLLDNNQITNIDNILTNHNRLKLLSVTGNCLKTIEAKNIIEFKLRLSNNPFRCDCSTVGLKHFVSSNAQNIEDYSLIHCTNSFIINDVETTLLKDITDEMYCVIESAIDINVVIASSATCLVILILVAVYYKNRNLVIAYTFIHFNPLFNILFNETALNEEKKYDAFIAYSSSDREIAMDILNELEKPVDGRREFRLCIHERDFTPGHDITKNIVESIENSCRTILIVSNEFVKSQWFEIEFRTAYIRMQEDQTNSLIIVLKGDLKDSINDELRLTLSKKTYLRWGEKWFWEKLRYVMPHKQRVNQRHSKEVIA